MPRSAVPRALSLVRKNSDPNRTRRNEGALKKEIFGRDKTSEKESTNRLTSNPETLSLLGSLPCTTPKTCRPLVSPRPRPRSHRAPHLHPPASVQSTRSPAAARRRELALHDRPPRRATSSRRSLRRALPRSESTSARRRSSAKLFSAGVAGRTQLLFLRHPLAACRWTTPQLGWRLATRRLVARLARPLSTAWPSMAATRAPTRMPGLPQVGPQQLQAPKWSRAALTSAMFLWSHALEISASASAASPSMVFARW